MKGKNHYILGFERRNSGAFEHSWNLAKNLKDKGFFTKYFANWFNSPIEKIDLETEEKIPLKNTHFKDKNKIIHLQTHTWEYNGLLNNFYYDKDSKIIFYLHAIIPYLYMKGNMKSNFLEGKLSKEEMAPFIGEKLSERERSQLSAINKSDHLITISKKHKKALENLGFDKPITVLENVSDFYNLNLETINEGKNKASEFRDFLGSENVLIYAGNLYARKGANAIFDSFKKIKREYVSSSLLILGVGDQEKNRLCQYGLDDSIKDDIHLIPWINKHQKGTKEEFLKYYFASDVLIQPIITSELYAKTVIDAMTLGIPTITCESPYSIGTSKNGDEIFESFVFMKNNPNKVKEIVDLSREKVKRENTWDNYILNLERIINCFN